MSVILLCNFDLINDLAGQKIQRTKGSRYQS